MDNLPHDITQGKVMKLTVLERILLSQILPQEGSFTNLKLLRVIREEISFSEKENKALNFKQTENQTTWNPEYKDEKEIKTGEVVNALVKKALLRLDEEEKLTESHVSLYEKFMGK